MAAKKKTDAPGKAGRPSKYSQELADEICNRMIEGESLLKICRDDHLPTRMTIYNWYDAHPEFYARCRRAREGLADFLVDEIEELASKTTEENYQSMKIKISTKQWRAMKMAPRIYGERTTTELTGANGGAIQLEAKRKVDLSNMSEEELEQVEGALRLLLNKPQ